MLGFIQSSSVLLPDFCFLTLPYFKFCSIYLAMPGNLDSLSLTSVYSLSSAINLANQFRNSCLTISRPLTFQNPTQSTFYMHLAEIFLLRNDAQSVTLNSGKYCKICTSRAPRRIVLVAKTEFSCHWYHPAPLSISIVLYCSTML